MNVFVARQPVFNREQRTVGYELLFRSSWENVFSHPDPSEATGQVIHNSLMEFGLATLVGSNEAYLNITRDVLLKDLYTVLPTKGVVLELTEDVRPEGNVLAACRRLKRAGYRLALDDFKFDNSYEPLLELADVVKVDFLSNDEEECGKLTSALSEFGVDLVAEKVEGRKEFRRAQDLGYGFFQGFFFCKPEIVSRKEVPKFKLNYVRFLQAINQRDISFDQLEEVIKREVSLSLKLLRYINSAALGISLEVKSIKHALTLLGERKIKKWASAVALSSLGEDKPAELAITGLIRAQFCETIGRAAGHAELEADMFLLGMMSIVDGLLDRPKEEILSELPLATETKEALLGGENRLSSALDMVRSFERGDWHRIAEIADNAGLCDDLLTTAYREAIEFANLTFTPSRTALCRF